MDHFDLYARMRASKSDPVRRWAEMEGKSPTMSDDLCRRHTPPRRPRMKLLPLLVASSKLVATIVQSWLDDSR
jgi:hypothetical protein